MGVPREREHLSLMGTEPRGRNNSLFTENQNPSASVPVLHGLCVLLSIRAVRLHYRGQKAQPISLPAVQPRFCLQTLIPIARCPSHPTGRKEPREDPAQASSVCLCCCMSSKWSWPPEFNSQSQSPGMDRSPLLVLHMNSDPPGFHGGLLHYCSS